MRHWIDLAAVGYYVGNKVLLSQLIAMGGGGEKVQMTGSAAVDSVLESMMTLDDSDRCTFFCQHNCYVMLYVTLSYEADVAQ